MLLRLAFLGLGLSPADPIPCSNRLILSVVEFPVGAGVIEALGVPDGPLIAIIAGVVLDSTFSLACSLGPAERV